VNPFVLSVDRGSSNQTMNRQIVTDAVLSIVMERRMGSAKWPTVNIAALGHCVCFSGGCFKAYRFYEHRADPGK
jgi:hypothetical protein